MNTGIVNGSILLAIIVLFVLLWIVTITAKERGNAVSVYRKKRVYQILVLVLSILAFFLFYFFDSRIVAFLCMVCAGFFYIRMLCFISPSAVKTVREQQEKHVEDDTSA